MRWTIENYSEKSIAVFAENLGPYADILESLNGTRNNRLKGPNDSKRTGYVFPKHKMTEVQTALQNFDTKGVVPTSSTPVPPSTSSTPSLTSASPATAKDSEQLQKLQKLVQQLTTRLDAAEAEISSLRKLVLNPLPSKSLPKTQESSSSSNTTNEMEDEDSEENNQEVSNQRMIVRKRKPTPKN